MAAPGHGTSHDHPEGRDFFIELFEPEFVAQELRQDIVSIAALGIGPSPQPLSGGLSNRTSFDPPIDRWVQSPPDTTAGRPPSVPAVAFHVAV